MAIACIIALAVFAVMGIWSAQYRALAGKAWDCAIRTVTLRPCEAGLDKEIKASVVAKAFKFSPWLGKMAHRHFEAFSLLLVLVSLASFAYAAYGGYNYLLYGNCDGPVASGGFCVYQAIGDSIGFTSFNDAALKVPPLQPGITLGNSSAAVTLIEVGCYACPYTKTSEPFVRNILAKYGDRVYFVFKPVSLPQHQNSRESAIAAWCAYDEGGEGVYEKYAEQLFARQADFENNGDSVFKDIASQVGLSNFSACFDNASPANKVDQAIGQSMTAGVYGTPTFFVNGKAIPPTKIGELEQAVKTALGE